MGCELLLLEIKAKRKEKGCPISVFDENVFGEKVKEEFGI